MRLKCGSLPNDVLRKQSWDAFKSRTTVGGNGGLITEELNSVFGGDVGVDGLHSSTFICRLSCKLCLLRFSCSSARTRARNDSTSSSAGSPRARRNHAAAARTPTPRPSKAATPKCFREALSILIFFLIFKFSKGVIVLRVLLCTACEVKPR